MSRSLFPASVLVLCCAVVGVSAQTATTYVDFGSASTPTASPDSNGRRWNNVTDAVANPSLPGLVTDAGHSTGISLSVSGFAAGANVIGTTVPDSATLGGLAVSTASSDSFYVSGADVLTVTLANMPSNGIFRLSLFASRNVGDVRITRYEVSALGGTTSQLLQTSGNGLNTSSQPNGNRSSLAVFENLSPDANGRIVIAVKRHSGEFGYIGAMRLETMNTVNYPPVADAVAVAGAPRSGEIVSASYVYSDREGDAETGTSFTWERAATATAASGTVMATVNGQGYYLSDSDIGYYYRVGVKPKAAAGQTDGGIAYSAWKGPVRAATAITTFHIGNSFTRWGNIPQELSDLAKAGGTTLVPGYQLTDAQTLRFHWDNGYLGFYTGTPSRAELASGTWDAVVLQPFSREWMSGSMAEFQDYAKRYYTLADEEGAQVYLYAYWPYQTESVSLQSSINASFEQIRAAISAGGNKPALIIPAGEALRAVAAEMGTGALAGLNRNSLYFDERHPSDLGAYIAALTHYATILKKSPVGLPGKAYNASFQNDDPVTIPPAVAAKVQEIVWRVVATYPNSGVTDTFTPVNPPNPTTPPVPVQHATVSNASFEKWAFGAEGTNGETLRQKLPHAVQPGEAAFDIIEFNVNADAEATGVRYVVEWSTDLVHWYDVLPSGTVSERSDQVQRVKLPKGPKIRFLRVYLQAGS